MANDNNVQVGDMIMSYDFPGRKECFYIGIVTEVNEAYGQLKCNTLSRIWRGVAEEVTDQNAKFDPPMQGCMSLDDPEDPRIVVLKKAGQRA